MKTHTSRSRALQQFSGMLVLSILAGTNLVVWADTQPAPPTVSVRLSNPELIDDQHGDLKLTLNFPIRQQNASVAIASDPAIQITPRAVHLEDVQGPVILHFDVVGVRQKLTPGDHVISADLSLSGAAGGTTVASDSVTLKYSRRVRFSSYLIWGLVGVALGYVLRLLTKVLASIPMPSPAPPDPNAGQNNPIVAATGEITKFVQKHYYLVEFTVTCVLGFLALLALAKSGMAPDGAAYWNGALLLGVSLGFLTNTDLILRIK